MWAKNGPEYVVAFYMKCHWRFVMAWQPVGVIWWSRPADSRDTQAVTVWKE